MSVSRDAPRILIEKAAEDKYALDRLIGDPDAPDSILGFHAQQAVEKCIKAVLANRGLEYARTHDLAGLIDRLRREGLADPPDAERLPVLTPYGARARYAELPPELSAAPVLDRTWAQECVARTMAWAAHMLSDQGPEGQKP